MNTRQLQKAFESLWTMQDVKDRFNVTAMTVHNWRNRDYDPLPVLSLAGSERTVLRFVRRDVEAWATRNKRIRGKPMPVIRGRERVRRLTRGQVAAIAAG